MTVHFEFLVPYQVPLWKNIHIKSYIRHIVCQEKVEKRKSLIYLFSSNLTESQQDVRRDFKRCMFPFKTRNLDTNLSMLTAHVLLCLSIVDSTNDLIAKHRNVLF